jgi:4'-phosphopantetheinyl transferase EntD
MPLVRLESVNADCCWALWEINENPEELTHLLQPTTDDLTYLNLISHEHKRLEWLASRIAVKRLLQHWGYVYRGIRKDSLNKPLLNAYSLQVSLSHAGQYGAAILHRHRKVGIDIEYCKEKIIRIQHKFLSAEEILDAGDQLKKLTVYWCAKEVLYKIYPLKQLSFSEHMQVSPFDLQSEGKIFGKIVRENEWQAYEITYLSHDVLTVAYAY